MASISAVSTHPMRMALSGPPGLAGSTLSSSQRWRYDLLVTQRINEKDNRERGTYSLGGHCKPQLLTVRWSYLSRYCLFTKTYLFEFSCFRCLLPDVSFHLCSSSWFILPPGPFLKHNATIIPFSLEEQRNKINLKPTVHCAGFTQLDMVVQLSPAESHTSDFFLTCNLDLPSGLIQHLDCGLLSLPIAV